jgi:hypothetical protein
VLDRCSRAFGVRHESSALRAALRSVPSELSIQLLYWKYARELHPHGRLRLAQLSKVGERSQYLMLRSYPLRTRCPCPMCGQLAELAIAFVAPTQHFDARLICPACEHRSALDFSGGDSDIDDFPVAACPCEACAQVRDEWAHRLYEWCQTFSARLADLLIQTANGVAQAYLNRGPYQLLPSGELLYGGTSRGRFVEYLLASTLPPGAMEDALRSALHWGVRGVFAAPLVQRFGMRPTFEFPNYEAIEVLKQAVAGPRLSPASRTDSRQELRKAEQLTRLLAGYSKPGAEFRAWFAACAGQLGPSRVLMLPLTASLQVVSQPSPSMRHASKDWPLRMLHGLGALRLRWMVRSNNRRTT